MKTDNHWRIAVAGAVGALFGFVASYRALLFGSHGGPALPAAIVDGPIIVVCPFDDLRFVAVMLGGGAVLYGVYGCLLARPPRFLGRSRILLVIAIVHAASAILLLNQWH